MTSLPNARTPHLDDDDDDDDPGKEKLKPGQEAARPTSMIEERLFKSRHILIFGEVNQTLSRVVTERLIALSSESDEEIRIFINSQGGHVESGDTMYDMIKFVKPVVKVIGTGWVASAGALIYLAAKPENRLCLPNTRFLLHQPSGGAGGQASDIAIQAREIIKMKRRLNEIIARETRQSIERVEKDTERDYWMSAEEAKEYGIVSRIVGSAADI
jgi:ATP-dependent Clp protease protease subunit